MKRKIVNFLLSLCLLVSCSLAFTACEPSCEHDGKVTRIPTVNMPGEFGCFKCGQKIFEFPKLNETDYQVQGTNPDYKTYVYSKDGETYEFSNSNFDVYYDSDTDGYSISEYYGSNSSVIIPETYTDTEGTKPVTIIGGYAFEDNTNLTSITFPSSLKEISDGVFSGCSNLAEINLPNGLTRIGNYAFNGCSLITSVVIPNTVETIGGSSFEGCTSLRKLTLPYSVGSASMPSRFGYIFGDINTSDDVPTSLKEVVITGNIDISEYAFEGAESIETVIFDGNINTVGKYAFQNCTSLKKVVLSEGVKTINSCVFQNCTALKEVVISSTIETIDNAAFYNCNALESVYYAGTKTSWNNIDIGTYNNNNAKLTDAERYYYLETQPTVIDYLNNNQKEFWHFNQENNVELWQMNITNNVDGKTFAYSTTSVSVTDEYWQMLQIAKSQNFLESLLAGDQAQIDMVVNSNTKAEYESALAQFFANAGNGLSVKFNDDTATLIQGGQSATPLDYVEIDGEIYYVLTKTKAFTYNEANGTIYEQKVEGYVTVTHVYTIVE